MKLAKSVELGRHYESTITFQNYATEFGKLPFRPVSLLIVDQIF